MIYYSKKEIYGLFLLYFHHHRHGIWDPMVRQRYGATPAWRQFPVREAMLGSISHLVFFATKRSRSTNQVCFFFSKILGAVEANKMHFWLPYAINMIFWELLQDGHQ